MNCLLITGAFLCGGVNEAAFYRGLQEMLPDREFNAFLTPCVPALKARKAIHWNNKR
jgi:hypothetical protein